MVLGCHPYRNDILTIQLHNFFLKYLAIEGAALWIQHKKHCSMVPGFHSYIDKTSHNCRPKVQPNVFFAKTYIVNSKSVSSKSSTEKGIAPKLSLIALRNKFIWSKVFVFLQYL